MQLPSLFTLVPTVIMIIGLCIVSLYRERNSAGHRAVHDHAFYDIDLYAHQSKLNSWNPGLKALFSLALLLISLNLNNNWNGILIIVLCAFMTVCLGSLTISHYVRLLLIPIVFLIMSSLIILFEYSSHVPVDALMGLKIPGGYLYTDANHLKLVTGLIVKSLSAVSSLYLLILSTPINELFGLLEKIHCPEMILELMQMMYRFIFILLTTQQEMSIAARSRLGTVNYRTSLRTFGMIGANLLIVSLKKATAYYDALESRLYDGTIRFLKKDEPVQLSHMIGCLGVIIYLGFLRLVDF